MEEKIDLTLPEVKEIKLEIGGSEITLDYFIDIQKCSTIVEDINSKVLYNSEITDKYPMMLLRFNRDVVELCTNIDVESLNTGDFFSPILIDALKSIANYEEVKACLDKEYERYIIENSFGMLAQRLPSEQEMNNSMDRLAETIKDLPEDKLEMIAKSIVWNNSPALGKVAAPAQHTVQGE